MTRKFGSPRLLGAGILITGLGLTLIPYVPSQSPWLPMILVVILIALGNGLFQPSYSSILAGLTDISKS